MKSNQVHYLILLLLLVGCTVNTYAQSPESLDEKRERRKNLTVREYNSDAKGQSKWMDHLTVYNALGLKVEEVEYAVYGQREKVVFEYDNNNLCVKEVVYDDRNKITRIRKYTYNADGTKKMQYNYLPNGRLYSTKVYQYTR
jgi:hypothetical protein